VPFSTAYFSFEVNISPIWEGERGKEKRGKEKIFSFLFD
jgi:hypothetical protein